MQIPDDLLYSREHEWVRFEGTKAFVGITDYAQHELGDIAYVELPELNSEAVSMVETGTVESNKAVASVFSPMSGRIVEINEELMDNPALLNTDPYGNFILAVEVSDMSEKSDLLDAAGYSAFCAELDEKK